MEIKGDPVKLQKNPVSYGCLATSFAMCLDMPIADILACLPDGSVEVFHHKEHQNERGFHPQELIDVAFGLGFYVMEIEGDPKIGFSQDDRLSIFEVPGFKEERLDKYMRQTRCVVSGRRPRGSGHAVAYDPETKLYYDPAGQGWELNSCPITKDIVFLIFDPEIKS